MIERQCEVCGTVIFLKRSNSSQKYCKECAYKVKIANQKKAQKELRERKQQEQQAKKAKERDKLDPFLRELNAYNQERRKRGECPISYGKYVALRGGLIDV